MTEAAADHIARAAADVTISLTTTSRRIARVEPVLLDLLSQDVPAARVILWLSSEPFDDDAGVTPEAVPPTLRMLEFAGLTIRWTRNIGRFRALLPALASYGGNVVTADDAMRYPVDWLRALLALAADSPAAVCGHRAHRITLRADGTLQPASRWPLAPAGPPSATCLPIGRYGVWYPRAALHPEVRDDAARQRHAPIGPDAWFKLMALRQGTPARCVAGSHRIVPARRWSLARLLRRDATVADADGLAAALRRDGLDPRIVFTDVADTAARLAR
jgi:hypothetical protein